MKIRKINKRPWKVVDIRANKLELVILKPKIGLIASGNSKILKNCKPSFKNLVKKFIIHHYSVKPQVKPCLPVLPNVVASFEVMEKQNEVFKNRKPSMKISIPTSKLGNNQPADLTKSYEDYTVLSSSPDLSHIQVQSQEDLSLLKFEDIQIAQPRAPKYADHNLPVESSSLPRDCYIFRAEGNLALPFPENVNDNLPYYSPKFPCSSVNFENPFSDSRTSTQTFSSETTITTPNPFRQSRRRKWQGTPPIDNSLSNLFDESQLSNPDEIRSYDNPFKFKDSDNTTTPIYFSSPKATIPGYDSQNYNVIVLNQPKITSEKDCAIFNASLSIERKLPCFRF